MESLYEDQARKFLNWVSSNYEENKNNVIAYAKNKQIEWNEDIYNETILYIYNLIMKKGLSDTTDNGFKNYLFMALRNNILREQMYARNQKKDANTDNIDALYDVYYNSHNLHPIEKIKNDTLQDFSVIYILKQIEKHFDADTFNYVRLKFFLGITYKQLIEMTGNTKARQKVSDAIKWVKENITKTDIHNEFIKEFGDELLDD